MDRNESRCAEPARPEQSHNYDSKGRRVGGFEGGIYLVPASEIRCVLERRWAEPQIMNRYAFKPRSPESR